MQLRRARDHADLHFAEPIDLAGLATVACLSKYYFHRLFTATYGRTPAAYLQDRRIERAPRVPGCYVFMWGLVEREIARGEKPPERGDP